MSKKSRLRYAKTTSSSSSAKLSGLAFGSWKLYLDCKKLPLSIFLECLIDKDFSGLIIEGRPPEIEIEKAWNQIFEEYSKNVGGDQYNEVFIKTKAVNVMVVKIYLVNTLCDNLALQYYEPGCKILNNYALKCDLKPEDDYQIRVVKINAIRSRALRFTTQLDKLRQQLKHAQKDTITGQGGQDYFDEMLNVMSEESGYMIRATDITVSRFLKLTNTLRDRQKQMELKSLKHGG